MSSVLLLALNWRDTDALGAMEGTAIGLPLEFVYLSSGLSARGIAHTFRDAWLYDRALSELAEDIRAASLVVICSAPSYLFWRDGITNIDLASRSVGQIKAISPEVRVALVGPHGTVEPEGFLDMGLDFLLRGEPDETLPLLAEQLLAGAVSPIRGVVDLRGEGPPELGCSVEVKDLGALPPTDLSRFRIADYPFPPASGPPELLRGKVATLYEASRGCPYACIYCFKIGFRDKYRVKPPERIDRELKELAELGVGYVYLIDEIFFLKRKWALEVLPLFAKHGIAWGCQTRASCLTPEVVTAALDTGTCGLVQIGLEHTNSEVLAAIGKSETDVVALGDALHRLTEGGVKVQLFLVSGLPGDDPSKHAELAETLSHYPMDKVDCIVHPAMPFPGTKLWEQGVAEGHGLSGWDDIERAAGLIGSGFSTREEVERESFRLAGRVRAVSDEARIRRAIAERRLPDPLDLARLAKHRLDVAAPKTMGALTRRKQKLRSGPFLPRRARRAPARGRHVLLGPGAIAHAHAHVLSEFGQALGVVGRNEGRARDFADAWAGARVYASLDRALEDPEVHAVVVSTPPHAHERACLAVIAAGKHLLLEKPVAHDLASARRILEAYLEQPPTQRGALVVAEQARYLPFARVAQPLLGERSARTYRFVEARVSRPVGWRLDPQRAGGGVLLDVGVHYIALAKEVFGEVTRATRRVLREERGLPMHEVLELEHRSGARGAVEVAWGAARDALALEIGGRGKRLRYRMDSRLLWVGSRPHPVGLRGLNGRHRMIETYLDEIEQGRADPRWLQAAVDDMELALQGRTPEPSRRRPRPLPTA